MITSLKGQDVCHTKFKCALIIASKIRKFDLNTLLKIYYSSRATFTHKEFPQSQLLMLLNGDNARQIAGTWQFQSYITFLKGNLTIADLRYE